jgi:hypothetical protein
MWVGVIRFICKNLNSMRFVIGRQNNYDLTFKGILL